jgi:hypothetical protein
LRKWSVRPCCNFWSTEVPHGRHKAPSARLPPEGRPNSERPRMHVHDPEQTSDFYGFYWSALQFDRTHRVVGRSDNRTNSPGAKPEHLLLEDLLPALVLIDDIRYECWTLVSDQPTRPHPHLGP